MKIQVLSQSFYPDHSGISLYASEFAFYAAEKGNDVEVLTGFPFYPYWKKRKEDRRKLFGTDYVNKVKILRGYIYVPALPTTLKRVIHEITLLTFIFLNFFRAKKPDLIVVFTTPILLGLIGAIFKKFYGCKLIINVQDFQLEAANSLGMSNSKSLFKILSAIERFSYKQADMVTSISNSMYKVLKDNKRLEEYKIDLWPNWINKGDYVLDESKKGEFRKIYDLDERDVIVAYAGNIGLKQGLEILVDLAHYYERNPRLKFFIIGQGAALSTLMEYSEQKQVKNLIFLPLLNSDDYIKFLNDLNIFFLPQKKTEFDVYFPSKLLGLIAAKKTIILAADKQSELFKTFDSNKIGFTAEYGDVDAVSGYIDEIMSNIEKASQIQKNAELYIDQFDKNFVLDNMLEKIYQSMKEKRMIVTGSAGLIGSEVVSYFAARGWKVYGIDNNMRADFFGKSGDTTWNAKRLVSKYENYTHLDVDIRSRKELITLIASIKPTAIVHTAAQPSHDLASSRPFDDFDVNATGTLNLLEAVRQYSTEIPFVHMSTNKVYGDAPNNLNLVERATRWDYADAIYFNGIKETFTIDQSKHSLFGASKVAGDVMVQEYGRYFNMPTCCLRGGCLTGPNHSGVELHGFLSYLIKCNLIERKYTIYGYKGKQVRDNIHSYDVATFIEQFISNPRYGEVYNMGGGRANSISILEAFDLISSISNTKMIYEYSDKNREGDHICYISDLAKMKEHYPAWDITKDLKTTFHEIHDAWNVRLLSKQY